MHAMEIIVTPDMAKAWLEENPGNRPLRKYLIDKYAKTITRGEWKLTHQGLAFDKEGKLLDGQHRLHGVIVADMPAEMFVTFGADRSTFSVLDQGGNRSIADLIGLPKKQSEVLTILARLNGSFGEHPSSSQVAEMIPFFNDISADLMKHSGTTTRRLSTAPIRAMAVLRCAMGDDTEYKWIFDSYRALTLLRFEDMCPVTQVFARQMLATPAGTQLVNILPRAWLAFDMSRHAHTRIQITNNDTIMNDISAAVRKIVS